MRKQDKQLKQNRSDQNRREHNSTKLNVMKTKRTCVDETKVNRT